jgi:hypothetical protein
MIDFEFLGLPYFEYVDHVLIQGIFFLVPNLPASVLFRVCIYRLSDRAPFDKTRRLNPYDRVKKSRWSAASAGGVDPEASRIWLGQSLTSKDEADEINTGHTSTIPRSFA